MQIYVEASSHTGVGHLVAQSATLLANDPSCKNASRRHSSMSETFSIDERSEDIGDRSMALTSLSGDDCVTGHCPAETWRPIQPSRTVMLMGGKDSQIFIDKRQSRAAANAFH